MLYVFFGKDEFACQEALKALQQDYWPEPAAGDFNRTVLDGRRITLGELRHHCDAIPFLADRRLIIVEGLVTRLDGRERPRGDDGDEEGSAGQDHEGAHGRLLDELLDYLPRLPETTDLVLMDPGLESKRSRGRIVRWARSQGERAVVREFDRLRDADLHQWVQQRVKAAGGSIDRRAEALLVRAVGDDTRTLANEIEKLALYVDAGQQITPDHVQRLVPHSKEADIFLIVDAIGNRQWDRALAELRRILDEGAHPLYVLTMIHRQYRMIAQARALAGERLSPRELGRRLGVHEYPAKKALAQSRKYSETQIIRIYDCILATDLAIKTGQMDGPLALEVLIADLAR